MLSELLEVKRRRERGLRSSMALIANELQALTHRQQMLLERRVDLRNEWHELSLVNGLHTQGGLVKLRARLAHLEDDDKRITADLETLIAEQNRLSLLQAEQERLLRTILREQEKLQLLKDL